MLAVYGGLSRACELPCVVLGRIVHAQRQGQKWSVKLALPATHGIDPNVYISLLQHAANVLGVLSSTPPSLDKAQKIYAYIEQQVLSQHRGQLPGGRAHSFVVRLAHKLGVPFDYLGGELLQLGHGAQRQITEHSACLQDSAIAARACADKHVTALLLANAGLPAPVHHLVANVQSAQQAAAKLGWPVVVKPTDRERSEGVTVDVNDPAALPCLCRGLQIQPAHIGRTPGLGCVSPHLGGGAKAGVRHEAATQVGQRRWHQHSPAIG